MGKAIDCAGPGSEVQRPLAVVVIDGLIASITLTLILLPILYRRFGVVAKKVSKDEAPSTKTEADVPAATEVAGERG